MMCRAFQVLLYKRKIYAYVYSNIVDFIELVLQM
jgi:hypothetical protein